MFNVSPETMRMFTKGAFSLKLFDLRRKQIFKSHSYPKIVQASKIKE